ELDVLEQLDRLGARLAPASPLDPDRRLHDVLQRGHVREEVEALEDHADLPALRRDLLVLEAVQPALPLRLLLPVAHEVTVDEDPARLDVLELVEAPEEGRLARAGRPEQADDLSGRDVEVDALEHLG